MGRRVRQPIPSGESDHASGTADTHTRAELGSWVTEAPIVLAKFERHKFTTAIKEQFRMADLHERRLERLMNRLPKWLHSSLQWLRRPSSRWVRIPAGVLFIAGGFLSIFPLFGLWMFPIGLVLLAEDVPLLCRTRNRILDWIERRRPNWMGEKGL